MKYIDVFRRYFAFLIVTAVVMAAASNLSVFSQSRDSLPRQTKRKISARIRHSKTRRASTAGCD